MPSMTHESLLDLFRNRPSLAPELLRDALSVELPSHNGVKLESAELSQVVPTEYRADLVVLLRKKKPVLAIVVEVQLDRDTDKPWVWPAYVATLRERMRCPACLLVVTRDRAVASWCQRPITVGPGWPALTPFVLGPDSVPVVVDPAEAKAAPELSVLSAMAHGRKKKDVAVGVALTALAAVAGLDEERALFYTDLVMAALSEAAREALEAMMIPEGWEPQSELFKKHWDKGKTEGVAEGKRQTVLTLIERKFGALTEEQRQLVEATDTDRLIDRFLVAATLEELLA